MDKRLQSNPRPLRRRLTPGLNAFLAGCAIRFGEKFPSQAARGGCSDRSPERRRWPNHVAFYDRGRSPEIFASLLEF
jgi:hypothetical protein